MFTSQMQAKGWGQQAAGEHQALACSKEVKERGAPVPVWCERRATAPDAPQVGPQQACLRLDRAPHSLSPGAPSSWHGCGSEPSLSCTAVSVSGKNAADWLLCADPDSATTSPILAQGSRCLGTQGTPAPCLPHQRPVDAGTPAGCQLAIASAPAPKWRLHRG